MVAFYVTPVDMTNFDPNYNYANDFPGQIPVGALSYNQWLASRRGGGGGIFGSISNAISSIGSGLAAIDPGPSIGGALASVDPGPAIGSGLAEVDKFVNREIPGGWVLPATLAAAYATGYIDPSLFASEAAAAAGAEAGAGAIATEAGQTAFFNALSAGASSAEAVSAGLAADAALSAGALSAEQLLSSGGFTATPGSGASFVVDPSTALGAGSYVTPDLMGPTYGELGITGVEGGLAGPTYGELGYTGLNNAEAIAAADAATRAATQFNAEAALKSAATGAARGAAIGSAKAAIMDGDIMEGALNGAIVGAVGGGAGNAAGQAAKLNDLGEFSKLAASTAGGVAGGTTGALVSDRDPLTGALIGGITGASSNLTSGVLNAAGITDPTIASTILGAAKAAATGGDPLVGALSGAGSSLINRGVGYVGNEIKDALSTANTPSTADTTTQVADVPTQITDITQDPNYQAAIIAGFHPDEATAMAEGIAKEPLPAYEQLALNAPTGTVTVTGIDDTNFMPLVPGNTTSGATFKTPEAFPDANSPTGYSDYDGNFVNQDGGAYLSPLDIALNNIIGAVGPADTNKATSTNIAGPAGINGIDGINGKDGAAGPASINGIDGINGKDGAVGPAGIDGKDGRDGAVGPAGATGATGATGARGAVGRAGSDGIITTSSATLGALPGNLQSTSLAAAPVQESSMNLQQLKQLYPQLSTIDPRLLSTLMGRNLAQATTPDFGGSTGLSAIAQGGKPSAGYPAQAASNASSTNFASASPMSGSFDALSSAGLRALSGATNPYGLKDGGQPHVPQFKTGTTGHYVQGEGDGQSDDIPAMLADGEYVFDADTVAALGNGSNKAGALQLDRMRQEIRKHKRSAHHNKIPPKAKSPLEYMKEGK